MFSKRSIRGIMINYNYMCCEEKLVTLIKTHSESTAVTKIHPSWIICIFTTSLQVKMVEKTPMHIHVHTACIHIGRTVHFHTKSLTKAIKARLQDF